MRAFQTLNGCRSELDAITAGGTCFTFWVNISKTQFTYVLLKFYVLGNSSTSCSKLSKWTTFITMFYSWFTHCAQQGKTTVKTSVHLVHHAVKHRGDALIGYMIYLCFTNGVKT